jgi:hypothetical protein
MRLGHLAVLLPVFVSQAQEIAPVGILRADFVSSSGNAQRGELIFRNADNRLLHCTYDERTLFEHGNEHMTVKGLQAGDRMEIVSDRKEWTSICYVRTLEVIDAKPVRRRPPAFPKTPESIAPRGSLTFSGIVLEISAEQLLLRTRSNERKTIRLRADTRYLGGGEQLDYSRLPVTTRVFIRAGRNSDDELEAYQIVWGEILEPR